MKIIALADCPHLAPVIAQSHFGEWDISIPVALTTVGSTISGHE